MHVAQERLPVRIGNVTFILSRCRFLSRRIGNNSPQVTCSPANQLSSQTKQQGLPTPGLVPGRSNVIWEIPLFPLKMAFCCFTTIVLAPSTVEMFERVIQFMESGDDLVISSQPQIQLSEHRANPSPCSRPIIRMILSEHLLLIISCGYAKTSTCEDILFSVSSSAK